VNQWSASCRIFASVGGGRRAPVRASISVCVAPAENDVGGPVQEPVELQCLGARDKTGGGQGIDDFGRSDGAGLRHSDEMVAVNDVDVDGRHVETAHGPDHGLRRHKHSQPLVSAPCYERQAARRHVILQSDIVPNSCARRSERRPRVAYDT
jgi:hypothetical protein